MNFARLAWLRRVVFLGDPPPSRSALIPVLSIKICTGPVLGRYEMATFRAFWWRDSAPRVEQLKQAGEQPGRLPQRQPEKCFQRQASLDTASVSGRATPLSAGLSLPYRLRVKPDRQRAAVLQGGVVSAPDRRAVGRRCGFAHALRLTIASHAGNPSRFVQQSLDDPKRLSIINDVFNVI